MSRRNTDTPFAFSSILTEPVVRGLPGARERMERRKTFASRFLRRALRRLGTGEVSIPRSTPSQELANAARMWRTAAHASRSARVDSVLRFIAPLRKVIERHMQAGPAGADDPNVRFVVERAWRDAKAELDARLLAIDTRLRETDPASDEDNYYWMEAQSRPGSRVWDAEAVTLLAEEIRRTQQRLVAAKGNIKFLALLLHDLRWLADWGASPAEALTAVPSNRAVRQRLRRAQAHKAVLDDHLQRILASEIGSQVGALLRPGPELSP